MKTLRYMAAICAVLAVGSVALAQPISFPGIGEVTITANDAYAEIFLQNTSDDDVTLDLPGGGQVTIPAGAVINNVAIGYTPDDNGALAGGSPNMVLYTGAISTKTTYDGSGGSTPGTADGPPNSPNMQVLAMNQPTASGDLISDLLSGKLDPRIQGRLFVVGRVQTTRQAEGGIVDYALGPGSTDPDPQVTFTGYNLYINGMTTTNTITPLTGGNITTSFELSSEESKEAHVDFYADSSPDAAVTLRDTVAGTRYTPRYSSSHPSSTYDTPAYPDPDGAGPKTPPDVDTEDADGNSVGTNGENIRHELPVRDQQGPNGQGQLMGWYAAGYDHDGNPATPPLTSPLDTGLYYDSDPTTTWADLAFATPPGVDADQELVLSFVGNPESALMLTETFTMPGIWVDDGTGKEVMVNPVTYNNTGLLVPMPTEGFMVALGQVQPPLANARVGQVPVDESGPIDPSNPFYSMHPYLYDVIYEPATLNGQILWWDEGDGVPYWEGGSGIPLINVNQYVEDPDADPIDNNMVVLTSGTSSLLPELTLEGSLTPGPSLSPSAVKNDLVWYDYAAWLAGNEKAGTMNHYLIKGEDYSLSGNFLFGGAKTGAFDSDPNTFTFQEIPESDNLLQLTGPWAPEPMTMLTMLVAAGGLGGYVRRRRAKKA